MKKGLKSGILSANKSADDRPINRPTVGRLSFGLIMPPTLKRLMGHIAFGASVSGCVGASHFLYLL